MVLLAGLGLRLICNDLSAQPVVSYTISGTPDDYTLNFTVNNASPGTAGFDIYYWGVLADGSLSGTPSGYAAETFSEVHRVEAGDDPDWTFNTYWIDASYTHLPSGDTLSGFGLLDTDTTPPASIPYFAFGENGGATYTGPDNHNLTNPTNPLFLGYASVAVPEPATFPGLAAAVLVWLACSFSLKRSPSCSK